MSALHDHAIDVALEDVDDRPASGRVMGGHAVERGQPGYAEAARLGHGSVGAGWSRPVAAPGRWRLPTSARAWRRRPARGLDEALALLARVPTYRPVGRIVGDAAFDVLERLPGDATRSGSRPGTTATSRPTCSPRAIAKYFRNATREATLLEVCDAGIVFLPGRAGTVQEVFQDACENYYADESSVAPMVLVGRRTGPTSCRRGRCSSHWRGVARWRRTCTWSTRRRGRRAVCYRQVDVPGTRSVRSTYIEAVPITRRDLFRSTAAVGGAAALAALSGGLAAEAVAGSPALARVTTRGRTLHRGAGAPRPAGDR